MRNVFRKVWAGIFILVMVLGVAAVWRLALPQGGQEETPETEETAEKYEDEGVIYRFSDKDPGAYVFIRDHDGDGYGEDHADAFSISLDEDDIYGENGEHITEAELETGDRVKVVSNGMILETYPASYDEVFHLEVIKKADEAEREACMEKYGEALSWCYQEPDPSEPPVVQLIYSEGGAETCLFPERGGYQWSWETEDGQTETAVADAAFISEWTQLAENPEPPVTGKVEVHTSKEGADTVTVTRWPEEVRDMEEIPEGESVPVENLDGKWYFTDMEGGYYYLVRVCWGEDYVEYGILSQAASAPSGQAAGEGLLADASVETSAMNLYFFDGERVTERTIYEKPKELSILEELNALIAVEASEDRLSEWQVPCYGISIVGKDGYELRAAYSNGLWLDQEGKLYSVTVDFEKIWKQAEGEEENNDRDVLSFPNAGILGKRDIRFLLPAEEDMASPEGVTMTVTSLVNGTAAVKIENRSGGEIEYGMSYGLQKEIEGKWYTLPIARTNVGFNSVALTLGDQGEAEENCDLTIFGELGEGNYRLIKDDMAAGFSLDENGKLR